MFRKPQETNSQSLKQFYGTYRGFAPTDESPIALGELEVSINSASIKYRMATGLKVEAEEIPTVSLNPVTKEDMQSIFNEGSKYVTHCIGYELPNGLKFIFTPNAQDNEFGLLIRGNEMADILGPTILFSPEQVKRGLYDKAVENLEKEAGKGCFPKLREDGKVKK